MYRKTMLFVVIVTLQMLIAAGAIAADAWWSGNAYDNLWTSSTNWWSSGGVPVADGNAHLDQPLPLLCKINANTGPITTFDILIGDWSQVNNMADPNVAVLDINAQTLNVTRTMYIGLRETTYYAAGVKAVGKVNSINSAIINIGGDLWVGSEGVGYLNVRDGDVSIAGTLRCPGGPQPTYTGQRYTGGVGIINLYNGTITANDIYWRESDTTQINIAGGTLILNGDLTEAVGTLIGAGKMFAYGGGGNLHVDYNVRNAGKTTVSGTYNPNAAGYPSPANYALDVALSAHLSWTAGASSISHNVYLGTSFSDVNNATTSSTEIFKGNQTAATYNPGTLVPEQTYYWRIDELDATNTYKGGVWQFTAVNPYIASIPTPANGKTTVPSNQVLSWTKGISANSHDVYLSINYDDVYNANTSSSSTIYRGRITSATFTPSDLLLGPKTYYWRVDDVNSVTATVWKGKIWQFSTATYRLIDNFDNYTTTPGNRIYDVWKKSGGTSDVSAATYFSDGTTALIDYNAMKVTFDNSASPYYSEVNYPIPSTSSGVKRDWYSGGVAILGISLHGEPTNIAAAKLYVTVKDANGHSVTVYYPDANQTVQRTNEYWPWWLINLKDFSDGGIYMRSVRKLIIGLGDKSTASGLGLLYVDNVALYPPWCPEGFNASFDQSADADLNNDCMVNNDDLDIFVNDWLERSQTVTASAPPTPVTDSDLLVWYKFDELSGYTAYNSSKYGSAYDGLLAWDMWDTTGHDGNGGVILDSASAQYIDVPTAAAADTNLGGHSTVAFWLYQSAPQTTVQLFQIGSSDVGNIQVWSEWSGDLNYVCGRKTNGWQDSLFWGRYGFTNPASPIGQWNHYAFTKDHATKTMRIYFNGKAVSEYTDADGATMPAFGSGAYFTIGAYRYADGTGGYVTGIMDDFRLYARALTPAEVLSIAGGTSITQPILSQAEVVADGVVNFKDFTVMADGWMEDPLLWP